MSVTNLAEITNPEFRQSLAIQDSENFHYLEPMPKKPPVARLKIINNRPYYYQVTNKWDKKAQRCRQQSKYLGKQLPKGFRLIK